MARCRAAAAPRVTKASGSAGAGASSTQSSEQGNNIGQQASASSQSTQYLPINANVAPSVLSFGSNDGSVKQGNASSANSNATNENQSFQGNGAAQSSGNPQGDPGQWQPQPGAGASSTQSSAQGNNIGQQATASSQSTQYLPINVNVAPSILSFGSNDGSVTQGNASSASSNAQNSNTSSQTNLVGQAVGGVLGSAG